MAVIDVGYNTSQTSTSSTDYTIVVYFNPANGTGAIDYLWIKTNGAATGVDVASFSEVSAGNFSTNGYVEGLSLAGGVNELNAPGDFTAFNINENEYIGAWDYGHHINRGGSATGVCRYVANDNIPCTNVTFSSYTAYYCIYGTGITSDTLLVVPDEISASKCDAVTLETLSLEQEGFRFRYDNGNEAGAGWIEAQDANIVLSAGDIARIRFLINASGDPTSQQFQFEYRYKPSGGSFGSWQKVA